MNQMPQKAPKIGIITRRLTAFCPFLKSYARIISQKYSELHLIEGAHERHIMDDDFRDKLRCAFLNNMKMPDIILGNI